MTDRKLFKFYKSYFEIAKELSDKDRLLFYDALMNRQFLGIEPDLNGMARFAYISQKHSIDAQVKGWQDKMGEELTPPMQPPCIAPTTEEEEKEEVKEKEKGEGFESESNLDECINVALKHDKWVRLNNTTRNELEIFKIKLESEGINYKVPIDFKSHFSRWKKKNPPELLEPKKVYTSKLPKESNVW